LASAVSNPEVIDWSQQNNTLTVLRAIEQLITAENADDQ